MTAQPTVSGRCSLLLLAWVLLAGLWVSGGVQTLMQPWCSVVDTALVGWNISSTPTATHKMCHLACLDTPGCQSANYWYRTKVCELNSVSHLNVSGRHVVERAGSVYTFTQQDPRCNLHEDAGHHDNEPQVPRAEEITDAIRLVNGQTPNEGRVEVWYNGVWGTVCDDYWDMIDANVVCRQLGYPRATEAFRIATHGAGSGSIHLDDIHCTGTEDSLASCPHRGWGEHNCHHGEDASVKCDPYSIRLVNGPTPNEGRVEVWYNGVWGTVCDDDWDMTDANVVCRQLGYPRATEAFRSATHGAGSGSIHLDGTRCTGTEDSLGSCPHNGWGKHDCQHGDDASVKCYQSSGIRLVNGPLPNEGRVEVYHNGTWGTVCDYGWNIYDGHVACRQLGYPSTAKVWSWAYYGTGMGAIHLGNLACNGSESNLGACGHSGWGFPNCGHREDASVKCNLT